MFGRVPLLPRELVAVGRPSVIRQLEAEVWPGAAGVQILGDNNAVKAETGRKCRIMELAAGHDEVAEILGDALRVAYSPHSAPRRGPREEGLGEVGRELWERLRGWRECVPAGFRHLAGEVPAVFGLRSVVFFLSS